jgi:hypothetical protein
MRRTMPIPDTITVHVPFRIVKRGGRKEMVLPPRATTRARIDGTLVKALARAFRWKRMLDSGTFTSVTEIAEHEKLSFTYISRVVRLSLLAPDIVDAIMAGHQPPTMMLANLLEGVPVDWQIQRALWLADASLPGQSWPRHGRPTNPSGADSGVQTQLSEGRVMENEPFYAIVSRPCPTVCPT